MTEIIAAQKIEDVRLPAWVDREKDLKTMKMENVEGVMEDAFVVTAELPAHLRRDTKRFRPGQYAGAPVRLEVGQSIELGGVYCRVTKAGSFSCRLVKNRAMGRDIIVTRGTAERSYDREATEAHNERYWKDAREVTTRL